MNIQTIELTDATSKSCMLDARQYNATGTGAVDIYGSADNAMWEKLMTLTVSASAVSQRSSDLYPYVKSVATSGAPKVSITGFPRF